MQCPKCHAAMERIPYQTSHVDRCTQCRGLWFAMVEHERLKDAAAVMATEPITVQLRYLQTLLEIGATNNSTVVFPIPIEFLETLGRGPKPEK